MRNLKFESWKLSSGSASSTSSTSPLSKNSCTFSQARNGSHGLILSKYSPQQAGFITRNLIYYQTSKVIWNDLLERLTNNFVKKSQLKNMFSKFSCMFLNPNNFFQFELYNCSNLWDMKNLQEQVKKAFCYQKFSDLSLFIKLF